MAEAIITLPDGTKQRITGKSRQDIMAQAQQMMQLPSVIPNRQPQAADPFRQQLIPGLQGSEVSTVGMDSDRGAFNAALRSAATQAIDNVIGLADVGLTAGLRLLTNRPLIETERMRQNQLGPRLPTISEGILPEALSGENVVSGLQTAAQVPGALMEGEPLNLGQRFEEQLQAGQQLAAEHPVASAVGEIGADALTLATGRIPARGFVRAGDALRPPQIRRTRLSAQPALKNALDTSVRKLSDTLGRGALRAGEAGIEGATLALLQEGDPVKTAAFAAGAQGAGSLILTSMGKVRKRPLSSTFAALLVGHQIFKAVGPGQRNLFESSDEAINEIVAGYALGVLANVAGFNRIQRKGFAQNFPEAFTDAITAIPRGALTSLWEDLAKNEETVAPVLEKYSTGGFNENQRRRIERAFKNGNLGSEIQKMLENPSFREELDK